MTRGARRLWGAVAASVTAALAIAGCQDGYPIAATACDRYCDLGLAPGCGDYSPTNCVLTCEVYWNSEVCSSEFDAAVSCLKAHKHPLVCDYTSPLSTDGCDSALATRLECAIAYADRARRGLK